MIPRILVIDDIFGSAFIDRRNLCRNFGLADVTGDDEKPAAVDNPIAEAVFCSGQRRDQGVVRNDASVAINVIAGGWTSDGTDVWALVLLDLRFASGRLAQDGEPEGQEGDDIFGLRVLEAIRERFMDLPVVVLSSRDRSEVIEDCRKLGALDFIQRHGNGSDSLTPREILQNKLFEHGLAEDHRGIIVGRSIPLLKALRAARRAATGRGNILLLGETGTGKELLARYAHDVSPKAKGHYQIYHPDESEGLQEDALFGHEKGAFTGAVGSKPGAFELAMGGTLLIDEIGDVSENLQSRLLRPLENKVISRQGSTEEVKLDIQVVLATNKNLDEYVRTGRFKYDLLNRINASTIEIPPLRDRRGDIPLLSEKLLEQHCSSIGATWPRAVDPAAMRMLMEYNWPGNVRELSNVLRKAVNDNKGSELLISSDLQIGFSSSLVTLETARTSVPTPSATVLSEVDELLMAMETFEFDKDYTKLNAKLPRLQKAFATLLSRYLIAAIDATKKMKPGQGPDGEINITGAVSCMMGKQLKTAKAADVVKRIIQTDTASLEEMLKSNELLEHIYGEVLRLRPKKPK
ncbi:MAG: Nitrogen fixation protein VnfA [Syntrophorhabdus sp. PtaU1.Bin153]|nr:MAG: Nitrogen fixation protein VnfA [Syntrophorhabdus sp. PtaU1.Bin153]